MNGGFYDTDLLLAVAQVKTFTHCIIRLEEDNLTVTVTCSPSSSVGRAQGS